MRRISNRLAWIVGLFSVPVSFAAGDSGFHLYPLPGNLSEEEYSRALTFVRQVEDRLPKTFKERLGKDFVVSFDGKPSEQAEDRSFFDSITDAVSGSHAGSKNTLYLDRRMIPSASGGASEEAVGSLIHQLSRKYDTAENFDEKTQKDLNWCRKYWDATAALEPGQPDCNRLLSMSGRRSISERGEFQTLAGWNETGFILKSRTQTNQYKDRSPDPEEFKSPHEAFAVNMEKFMTDPEFACRRPSVYRYLREEFGASPVAKEGCDGAVSLPVSSQYSSLPPQVAKIDPKRIYQIQYLMADKGDDLESTFGHAMYRVVVCAPERKQPGPECLQDEADHLVLSYRGFVSDPKIGYLDGLTGKYPSRLYVLPFGEIKQQYNVDELRDLKAIPLRMTRSQIENFVGRAGEQAWQYNGRYYFLGNNCATEALNLLKGSMNKRSLEKLSVDTPMGLYDTLVEEGLADDSMLKDQRKATESGNFYAAKLTDYKQAFETIKAEVPALPYPDLPTMLEQTNPEQRGKLWDEVKLRTRDTTRLATAHAAFSKVEQLAQSRLRRQIMNGISQNLVDHPVKDRARIEKMKEAGVALETPAGIAVLAKSRGYGIPTDCELAGVGYGPEGVTDEQKSNLMRIAKDTTVMLEGLADKELREDYAASEKISKQFDADMEKLLDAIVPAVRPGT